MERPCTLLRLLSPSAVCVRLEDTGAFVLALLLHPLSPHERARAQRVHALAPAPARIVLGAYSVAQHAFTGCTLASQLPALDYPRVGYKRKAPLTSPPSASGAPPPHSAPTPGASPASDGPAPL